MEKYTPGPWFASEDGEVYSTSSYSSVAMVLMNDSGPENARLIAAAPDLYEKGRKLAAEVGALRAFEAEIREAIGNTNWSVLMDRLAGMDAAIAKAEVRS